MVLDSASMYFRAFFGVPEVLAPDGTPVNAVRGFLDFISRLVADYRPTHLVCAWDNDWRPQWRVDLIPSYKAHRVVAESGPGRRPDIEEVPDPLEVQVPVILEVLDAFGLCVVGADGFEADDVIGTLATGPRPCRWTSSPATATCSSSSTTGPGSGCSTSPGASGNHERVTDAVVVEKYSVLPSQYADFSPCAATPRTGCRGCPASVRRRPPRCF